MRDRRVIILAVLILITAITTGIFVVTKYANSGRCLKEGERATYEIVEEAQGNSRYKVNTDGSRTIIERGHPGKVRISVIDTTSSTTVWSREVVDPTPDIKYSYHLGKCGFYLPQAFHANYDAGVPAPPPNEEYSFELWKFNYFSDQGKRSLILSEQLGYTWESYKRYYSPVFTFDSSERYISLERSYLGKDDYALVIKDIKTGEDAYVLTLNEVLKKHPTAAGSLSVGRWIETPDGTYLWGSIYDGAHVLAVFSIRRDTWDVEILDTMEDDLPGVEGAYHPLSPYAAYSDLIVWAGGIKEVTDALFDEAVAEGRQKHLYVANLRTRERTLVATVSLIRDHRFNVRWLDNSTLQYTMPGGEVRTYHVK